MDNEKTLSRIIELAEEGLQIIDDGDLGSLQPVLENMNTLLRQLLKVNYGA